jgi:uncharacterized protein YndB with AHSA1/START domain
MSAEPVLLNDDSVVAEVEIAAPPERVFQALTSSDQLIRWWISDTCQVERWDIDPRLGGRWYFKTGKSTQAINGVDTFEAHGEILEYSPPRMLVYTWIANWNDQPVQTTVVSWVLSASQGGTHVKVTHRGLAKMPVARKDYAGGWTGVVGLLRKFLEKENAE